jgi:hypothetical protein
MANLGLSSSELPLYAVLAQRRSYAIEKSFSSAEIRSTLLKFPDNRNAQLILVELPWLMQQPCLAIAQGFC